MKGILFALAILLNLNAKSVHWQSNYDQAHSQALKESKNLMVLLIDPKDKETNRKIIMNTFMNQKYIDKIDEQYIAVLITKDQKISYPIESLFTVEYPTLFFINENNLFLCDALFGDINADRLEAHLLECK